MLGIFRSLLGCIFLSDEENGITPDLKGAKDANIVNHNPLNFESAMSHAKNVPDIFGLFYKAEKPVYNDLVSEQSTKNTIEDRSSLLDSFII